MFLLGQAFLFFVRSGMGIRSEALDIAGFIG
jgi:hypothetical protein